MMYKPKHAGRLRIASIILPSVMLACRPVLAIGWGEFFFVVLVIALLIGPPLYRLMRRINFDRGDKRTDKSGR